MLEFLRWVLTNYGGKKIAVVSHGAAIKCMMQEWCNYDYKKDIFVLEGQIVCSSNIEAPSVLKYIFDENKLVSIEKLREQ